MHRIFIVVEIIVTAVTILFTIVKIVFGWVFFFGPTEKIHSVLVYFYITL